MEKVEMEKRKIKSDFEEEQREIREKTKKWIERLNTISTDSVTFSSETSMRSMFINLEEKFTKFELSHLENKK